MAHRSNSATFANKVRIIGGKWRSKWLHFPPTLALRPTPNRIRETLFNWLMPHIHGARCLDLFAGSGALGFEALSRGAAAVTFVDNSPLVTNYLRRQIAEMRITEASVLQGDVPTCLEMLADAYDIVFLDPPFHQNMLELCSIGLEQNKLLKEKTFIYIEAEISLHPLSVIPPHWTLHRNGTAGNVGYYLAIRQGIQS